MAEIVNGQNLYTKLVRNFSGVKRRFSGVKRRFSGVKRRFSGVKRRPRTLSPKTDAFGMGVKDSFLVFDAHLKGVN